MLRFLVFGVLACGLVAAAIIGCGPRARVAGKKVVEEIDNLLGKLNVQEEKVLGALKDVQVATRALRDKTIEAKVQVKSFARKTEALQEEKSKAMKELASLKDLLKEAESNDGKITRGKKEVTIAELKGYAEGTIKRIKLLKDKLKSNETVAAAWAKNLDMLTKQDSTSKAQLAKLEDQIEAIRSKKSALDAMKQAENIIGPNESINEKFNNLSSEVDKLINDVDTEWAIQEAELEERMIEMSSPSVSLDELLNDDSDVSSTMEDIDAMLNEGG